MTIGLTCKMCPNHINRDADGKGYQVYADNGQNIPFCSDRCIRSYYRSSDIPMNKRIAVRAVGKNASGEEKEWNNMVVGELFNTEHISIDI